MSDAKKKSKQKAGHRDAGNSNQGSGNKQDNGLELLVITRETYRAPVDHTEPVKVQVGKKRFDAVNVARRGIGFIVPAPDTFLPGAVLEPVTVICGKTRIPLKGRVVHISPCEGGRYLCGMEILHSDEGSLDQFEAYLEYNRRILFSK